MSESPDIIILKRTRNIDFHNYLGIKGSPKEISDAHKCFSDYLTNYGKIRAREMCGIPPAIRYDSHISPSPYIYSTIDDDFPDEFDIGRRRTARYSMPMAGQRRKVGQASSLIKNLPASIITEVLNSFDIDILTDEQLQTLRDKVCNTSSMGKKKVGQHNKCTVPMVGQRRKVGQATWTHRQ